MTDTKNPREIFVEQHLLNAVIESSDLGESRMTRVKVYPHKDDLISDYIRMREVIEGEPDFKTAYFDQMQLMAEAARLTVTGAIETQKYKSLCEELAAALELYASKKRDTTQGPGWEWKYVTGERPQDYQFYPNHDSAVEALAKYRKAIK